ncbi:hypothetical protein F511_11174 [Dorcoceras hygrometricum]|uniref:Uncharacterized protein n=1 Tax=Dorcoceras hygrometricum TaxID=472368 RepID=A0A2Z7CAG8_9LAMI|nr:hypothetical protein F511_11174 [Dorcoceras hygrometricum]
MPPRRYREQPQDDDLPPPPPPQMTAFERANVEMLAGITRLLERQTERPGKLHEEDIAERFRKQGPKEFSGTTDPLIAKEWIQSMETIYVTPEPNGATRIGVNKIFRIKEGLKDKLL